MKSLMKLKFRHLMAKTPEINLLKYIKKVCSLTKLKYFENNLLKIIIENHNEIFMK